MALHRRAAKRDANEQIIFEAFKAAGCAVLPISAPGKPDAVVFHPNSRRAWPVEIKSKRGRLTPAQVRFRLTWDGPQVETIRTVEDAMALISNGWYGL